MNKSDWKTLLKTLAFETDYTTVHPVQAKAITAYETMRGLKLPTSYRSFCEVFGAGDISKQFYISVPGYKGTAKTYRLEHVEDMAHNGLEYTSYSKDPKQHERGIFFALDILRSYHFFDPNEITDARLTEYAVYTLFEDFEVKRTADDFGQFVLDVCLGKKHDIVINDSPIHRTFRPAST
jgi:SMI1/KNR4 family protein SUKH-1